MAKKFYGLDIRGKNWLERLPSAPVWTAADEGRIFYDESADEIKTGTSTGWLRLAPNPHGNAAHSSTFITATDVTFENLDANGDVGAGATQVSIGTHGHLNVPHSDIIDDQPTKHRLINDAGTGATELWSASKINVLPHSGLNDDQPTKHRLINDAAINTTTLWSSSKINTSIAAGSGSAYTGLKAIVESEFYYNKVFLIPAIGSYITYWQADWYHQAGDPTYIIWSGEGRKVSAHPLVQLNFGGSTVSQATVGLSWPNYSSFSLKLNVSGVALGWQILQLQIGSYVNPSDWRHMRCYWNNAATDL